MFDMIPFKRNNSMKRDSYFDEFFDNFFNNDFLVPIKFPKNNFRADLKETNNEYIIEADLPGISKDAVKVNYSNNNLVISAKREDIIENKDENYIRRERSYGEFKRAFYVDNVDENNIKASFKNGVLRINLTKLEDTTKARKQIEIE
ncbi:Hsp20/alpha crystallin family protein [Clostridium tetani]|uniref:Heat shock protein, molecular chaperone n=1 Tax=Clostridium tetani (strain Massachusetts / E88) TaxID=212717 RepID=Q891B1_CLOTE|nr:heat shock protein Hsp18 [Clostridium tetani]AAO36934.1 heat shock protein, molecular chaperone [Clostridium tetani E88]KGI38626.1 heat-shock protein [Clostridium tetani]KGI44131.1 heat-shock protein [Clostridium tetani]KHO30944.1 heat-shock protein [Clostridium tetani]KIG20944.1 heat-shock protein [Clostridium tetani]